MTVKIEARNLKEFSQIEIGHAFFYCGTVFVRMKPFVYTKGLKCNAVALGIDETTLVGFHTLVEPVDILVSKPQ